MPVHRDIVLYDLLVRAFLAAATSSFTQQACIFTCVYPELVSLWITWVTTPKISKPVQEETSIAGYAGFSDVRKMFMLLLTSKHF
jgi:hypothetical protein